jgi:hypothetical protein
VLDRNTVVSIPHDATVTREGGRKVVDVHDPRHSVAIREDGATLTLFFDPDTAELVEVRLTHAASGEFNPWQLMPKLMRYLQYARGLLAHEEGDVVAALAALRESGKARRGLPDDALEIAAADYKTLVSEGEPHPIKALAKLRGVDKSTASRWISAARRRGLLAVKQP